MSYGEHGQIPIFYLAVDNQEQFRSVHGSVSGGDESDGHVFGVLFNRFYTRMRHGCSFDLSYSGRVHEVLLRM